MFLFSFSLFDFSVDVAGTTNTGSWLTIASITMLITTYFINKLQESPRSFTALVLFLFEVSIIAILLFIVDLKPWGAYTIIFQLVFFFIFGFYLFNSKKYSSSFQQENITPEDFFPD
jgi:hypothetical protein